VIVTIIGARPQFIKAAVLSKELKSQGKNEIIIHTGQHYDYKMSEVFFAELGLPGAEVNLNVGSGSHATQTGEILTGIEKYLLDHFKDITHVLLYGDTNSTLAGALAASKLNVPIIHVEAGLRSYNMAMPEEINRVLTDHVSSLLFCSSEVGVENLKKEGITSGVHISGDIMLDAFNIFSEVASCKVDISQIIPANIAENYFLLTIHRPVNTDNEEHLSTILAALAKIDANIVWPVHPRNAGTIARLEIPSNVFIFEPLSYFEMMVVLKEAKKVVTDSGGLQKEAYWAKKPCITIRTETEWVETLHHYWNILTKVDENDILKALLIEPDPSTWFPLYGAGAAGKIIANAIPA
jgi:UDP-N-acetylglucosamine 2-epimerase